MKLVGIGDIHFDWINPISRIDNYPQAVLDKLNWISGYCRQIEADMVVQAGDWWHRKLSPVKEWENALIAVLSTFPCPIYSVSGNHDQYFCRADSVNRTPLGTLFTSGVVKHVPYLSTPTLQIAFQDFGKSAKPHRLLPAFGAKTLLVAHQYWLPDLPWCPDESWEPADVAGYDYAFLGHDHTPYPVQTLDNGTVLIRPGSLTRGTQPSCADKMDRAVQIFTLDTKTGVVQYVPVPVRPGNEVFSVQAVEKKEVAKDIRDFVKTMDQKYKGDGRKVEVVLDTVCTDTRVRSRCLEYYREAGITV